MDVSIIIAILLLIFYAIINLKSFKQRETKRVFKDTILKVLVIILYALVSIGVFYYLTKIDLDIEALIVLGQLLIGLGIIFFEVRNDFKIDGIKEVKSKSGTLLFVGILILIGIMIIITAFVGKTQDGRGVDEIFIIFSEIIIFYVISCIIYMLEYPILNEKIYERKNENRVSGICKKVVIKRWRKNSDEYEIVKEASFYNIYLKNRRWYYTYNIMIQYPINKNTFFEENDRLFYSSKYLPQIGQEIELYIDSSNKKICRVLSKKEKIFLHSLSAFIIFMGAVLIGMIAL